MSRRLRRLRDSSQFCETESSGGGETNCGELLSKKIIKLHTSEQAKGESGRQWDDVESVSYEFIKTVRSNNTAGILTTHDHSYKV